MKAFAALSFLAAVGLVAGFDLRQLKPLQVEMPVNPKYTVEELQEIYAAQKASPEHYGNLKQGTEPQAGKADVPLDEQNQRIINGNIATRGQFPWQVAITTDNQLFCGGSLISWEWVLTAAQCAFSGNSYQILVGSNRIDTPDSESQFVISSSSIVHAQFNPSNLNNDIAVIRVPYISSYSYINPITLRYVDGDLACKRVTISGWGRPYDGTDISPLLLYADLTVITNTDCALAYGNIISSSKICTSTDRGVRIRYGDTGGPLVYYDDSYGNIQVGIASFNGTSDYPYQHELPAVFTRVTSYLNWISSVTGIYIYS